MDTTTDRLTEAAPELLAALKEMIRSDHDMLSWNAAIKRAEAAIKKAGG